MVAYTGVIGPWGLFLFLALAGAVLWAVDRWMAALGFWSDEVEKGAGTRCGSSLPSRPRWRPSASVTPSPSWPSHSAREVTLLGW